MATAPDSTRRKTQAERRSETRAALLDATIECLVTYGYSGTTTGRIAEHAGVSRGAQTPYFRSRADLVTAAVAHLAEKRIASFHEHWVESPASVADALDAVWEAHQGPLFDAALELWLASRIDPELGESLQRVEPEVAAAIFREAQESLGPLTRRPGYEDDLIFALATIRGLALLRISNGVTSRTLARRWLQVRERLVRLLS